MPLREKFRWLARASLPTDRVEAIEDIIWSCDELPDVEILTNSLISS